MGLRLDSMGSSGMLAANCQIQRTQMGYDVRQIGLIRDRLKIYKEQSRNRTWTVLATEISEKTGSTIEPEILCQFAMRIMARGRLRIPNHQNLHIRELASEEIERT
jgi:hypothetical protein